MLVTLRKMIREETLAHEVGARLAAHRIARHLSQRGLASIAQIDAMQVSRYERGERAPSVGTLASLAQGLGVTTDELLFGVPHEQPIRDPRLLDRFRQLDRLDGETISMFISVLDTLLAAHGVGVPDGVGTGNRERPTALGEVVKSHLRGKEGRRNDG